VSVSKALENKSEGEIVLALWSELVPDLGELDEYGGGYHDVENRVADLLYEIVEKLETKKVASDYRRELLDLVLPYIESGNAGMDDLLDEIAHAACYNDGDLRLLAEAFEGMNDRWKKSRARRIYRQIGDREKYLELRYEQMETGSDYHDLATYHWDAGEKDKALQTAEKGLKKGKGRMDELRQFVAERAQQSGDRETYLSLQFDQATECLTLEKYKVFKKICTAAEWKKFEPKVLSKMKNAWRGERMKIHMHRKEYDQAMKILSKTRYPISDWDIGDDIRVAEKLEKRFPEEILKYYLSGLGCLTKSATRKEYARKAKIMVRVRRMLVDIIGDKPRWQKFAVKIKKDNARRPALQEEFARALPDWRKLG